MAIEICTDFLCATIQDEGRFGYARFGYRVCGACDQYAMRLANLLVGNEGDSQAAVMEILLMGGRVRFTEDTLLALTGANMTPCLDGRRIDMYQAVWAHEGQTLELSVAGEGLRTYLAVHGGFLTEPVMGSRSTDVDCHIGGHEGRKLRKGDLLPTISLSEKMAEKVRRRSSVTIPEGLERWPERKLVSWGPHLASVLRIVPGPQEECFTARGRETLVRSLYSITGDSNRMACRLKGPVIETRGSSDIISDPIVWGSVQISSDGQPIIMMVDHQTSGGYAKIGTVIRPDLNVLAQRRPGDVIKFEYVTAEEAACLYKKEQNKIRQIGRKIQKEISG